MVWFVEAGAGGSCLLRMVLSRMQKLDQKKGQAISLKPLSPVASVHQQGRKGSIISLNSTTSWRPSVNTHEPVGTVPTQTIIKTLYKMQPVVKFCRKPTGTRWWDPGTMSRGAGAGSLVSSSRLTLPRLHPLLFCLLLARSSGAFPFSPEAEPGYS